jgi:ABC-type transport system involved in multi-copper enzyme maturation permease subunit
MELLRQPIFLLLMTSSAVFAVFLASTPYFGFGDDPKLVKDSVLATLLLVGLFGAVISASASVAHEIRTGTALVVLSKPVGRIVFILGKYVGLSATLVVLTYVNLMSALVASKISFTAYGEADKTAFFVFTGAIALAYLLAGFTNYFLKRTFTSDAVTFVVILTTIAFIIIANMERAGSMFEDHIDVDYRLIPAALLILCAFLLLAGLALVCSTRLEIVPTLTICTLLFLVGLMSDYLFGRWAEPAWVAFPSHQYVQSGPFTDDQKQLLSTVITKVDANDNKKIDLNEMESLAAEDIEQMKAAGLDSKAWASVVYALVPNWQLFWLADALENDKTIPWSYVGRSFTYVLCYLGALMALAVMSFESRELN